VIDGRGSAMAGHCPISCDCENEKTSAFTKAHFSLLSGRTNAGRSSQKKAILDAEDSLICSSPESGTSRSRPVDKGRFPNKKLHYIKVFITMP
jgi:hypothetical protein